MIKRLLLLFLLITAPAAIGTDQNVTIYNYTTSRIVVNIDYQWYCILEPQEYRGLAVPWDKFVYFDFYRYPSGSINTAHRVLISLGRFHPTELIYVTDRELPP